ncbi:DegT/DnrJ/EryC1/StrS family aminotransferase [Rhodobacteraceae bacterium]|nr:DegT/DnrJ/EryC1/StrS family aminotransferase [Paracoccaceae bacterium]
MTDFRTRAVWPEVPEVEFWAHHLEQNKSRNWHSNFGPLSEKLESTLHLMYGLNGESVVTACNATSGLSACLIAQDIRGPVLCPAFTFQASACAILGAGCQPIILDVDAQTGIVAPDQLRLAFAESEAKAAIIVAPYGISFDATQHARVCKEAGARLIIDNAAGLGINRKRFLARVMVDNVDEVFSLHATKPFGIGEGGAVFTPTQNAAALRSAINFGLATHSGNGATKPPYWGINGKMSEVAAAVGLAVAERMAERVCRRQEMVREWYETFADHSDIVYKAEIESSPWQVFPIFLQSETLLLKFIHKMAAKRIELRRYYFPSLGDCGGMKAIQECTNSRKLSQVAVVLPVRSFMQKKQRSSLMATALESLEQVLTEG